MHWGCLPSHPGTTHICVVFHPTHTWGLLYKKDTISACITESLAWTYSFNPSYQSLWQQFTAIQQERLKRKTTGLPTSQMWLQLWTSMFRLQGSVYHLYHNVRSDELFAVLHYLGESPEENTLCQSYYVSPPFHWKVKLEDRMKINQLRDSELHFILQLNIKDLSHFYFNFCFSSVNIRSI